MGSLRRLRYRQIVSKNKAQLSDATRAVSAETDNDEGKSVESDLAIFGSIHDSMSERFVVTVVSPFVVGLTRSRAGRTRLGYVGDWK